MADDQVNVKFGATIDGLVAGVEGVKAELEGLTAPVQQVGEALSGIGEILASVFAVDKIVEFAHAAIELGDQLYRASEITGVSVEQLSALKLGADYADVSFETLQRGLLRFAGNVQAAEKGTGDQAAAFAKLGISADTLKAKSSDLAGLFAMVAERLEKFADDGNKAAIVSDIFGVRMAQLAPLLHEVAENGMAGLEDHARELGVLFGQDFADSAKKAHDATVDLTEAWIGLKTAMADAFGPTITAAMHDLATILEYLSGAGKDALSGLADKLIEIDAELDVLQKRRAEMGGGLFGSPEAIDKQIAALRAMREEIEAQVRALQMAKSQGAADSGKPSVGSIDTSSNDNEETYARGVADALRLQNEELRQKIQLIDSASQVDSAYYDKTIADAKLAAREGYLSAYQEYQQFAALEDDKYGLAMKALNEKLQIYKLDETAYALILDQEKALTEKHFATLDGLYGDYLQTDKKNATEMSKNWQSAFDLVDHTFDTMLTGVLQGTQTWEQAAVKAFDNLATSFIEDVAKMMVKWAAFAAMDIGSNPFSGSGLGGLIGDAFGGIGSLFGGGGAASAAIDVGTLPLLDVGAWNIPQDMIAMVHKGEMVLPPPEAAMARAGAPPAFAASAQTAAAGQTINVSFAPQVMALDGKSAVAALNEPGTMRQLATNLGKYLTANPSVRGKY